MKRMIGLGHEKDGLYILDFPSPVATSKIKMNVSPSHSDELCLWHRRFGHLSFHLITKMSSHTSFT